MKKLMMTTALVAMTSMGAVAQTATTTTGTAGATATQTAAQNVPAFVASNFTGKNLYAFDSEEAREMAEDDASARWNNSEMFNENRDAWEDVGNIADIVMTNDGEIRGVLIDVGGFLGIGARTVLVEFDQLNFVNENADMANDGVATDTTATGTTGTDTATGTTGTGTVATDTATADAGAEDIDDFVIVAALSRDQLEALPEWDDAQLDEGFAARSVNGTATGGDSAQMNDPAQDTGNATGTMATDGYSELPMEERTAERLIGANAMSADGEEIAQVDDLVLDTDGAATHVIMDVGGFLGMGTHTVALDINEVDILWNDADEDVMVQVSMTEDQLRELPAHED